MLLIPKELESRDVNQWINSSVVLIDLDDALAPAEVIEVMDYDPESDCVPVVVTPIIPDKKTGQLVPGKAKTLGADECFLFWPTSQCVNLDSADVAVYVQRLQHRQYRRTFNSRGVRVVCPELDEFEKNRARMIMYNVETSSGRLAYRLMNPTYPSVEEALESLDRERKLSVAVSKSLIITASKNIYYRGERVAKLYDNRLVPLCFAGVPKALSNVFGRYT